LGAELLRLGLAGPDQPRPARHGILQREIGEIDEADLERREDQQQEWCGDQREFQRRRTRFVAGKIADCPPSAPGMQFDLGGLDHAPRH
jgi:hypothetical protein